MVEVTLKDGKVLKVEKGKTILEVAKQISEGLARMATCGEVNGKVEDVRYELNEDCELNICTFENSEEGKKSILAYNITYNGTGHKKIISKCTISYRSSY